MVHTQAGFVLLDILLLPSAQAEVSKARPHDGSTTPQSGRRPSSTKSLAWALVLRALKNLQLGLHNNKGPFPASNNVGHLKHRRQNTGCCASPAGVRGGEVFAWVALCALFVPASSLRGCWAWF